MTYRTVTWLKSVNLRSIISDSTQEASLYLERKLFFQLIRHFFHPKIKYLKIFYVLKNSFFPTFLHVLILKLNNTKEMPIFFFQNNSKLYKLCVCWSFFLYSYIVLYMIYIVLYMIPYCTIQYRKGVVPLWEIFFLWIDVY